MIEQYLSNTNEIGTIHISQKILQLNKALDLVYFPKILQNFSDFPSHRIFRHMHEVLNIDKNKN